MDQVSNETAWRLVAVFALVLANGFFVAAEFAIVKLRQTRVEAIEAEAGWRGVVLGRVHGHLDAYLSACQLGITLSSLGLGWIGEPAFADLLEPMLSGLGIVDPEVVSGIAFFVAFLTISYLHIVIGELAPKSMAIRMSERVALWTAAPLYAFYWLMYPLIWGLNHSAFWVLRQLKLDVPAHGEGGYSVDEIKLILRSTHVDSAMASDEWRVLAQALDFGDAEAADLMRPFKEAVVLSRALSVQENLARITTHRFSRYPYLDAEGRVVGVVHLKDLFLTQQGALRPESIEAAVRPPLLVAPDLPASELFRRFRLEGQHMAIIGYAGHRPTGMLTFDDVLSALVGGIRDEFRRSRTDWTRLEDGSVIAMGTLPIFTLEQFLGIDIDAQDVRTVGGLIMQKLETLPEAGQRIEFESFDVVVEKMEGARMTQIHVYPKVATPDDDFSG